MAMLLPCTERTPSVGDVVLERVADVLDGGESFEAWKLPHGQEAVVVAVDTSGDFKLRNPDGEVSEWTHKRRFSFKDCLQASLVHCSERIPNVGEAVLAANGLEYVADMEDGEDDTWKLPAGEAAYVVAIDKEGDFKLRNPEGCVCDWTYRKRFVFQEALRASAAKLAALPSSTQPETELTSDVECPQTPVKAAARAEQAGLALTPTKLLLEEAAVPASKMQPVREVVVVKRAKLTPMDVSSAASTEHNQPEPRSAAQDLLEQAWQDAAVVKVSHNAFHGGSTAAARETQGQAQFGLASALSGPSPDPFGREAPKLGLKPALHHGESDPLQRLQRPAFNTCAAVLALLLGLLARRSKRLGLTGIALVAAALMARVSFQRPRFQSACAQPRSERSALAQRHGG